MMSKRMRLVAASVLAALCLSAAFNHVTAQNAPIVNPNPVPAGTNPLQDIPFPNLGLSFTQTGQAQLAVNTTSARVALPTTGGNYTYICNTGTTLANYALGGSGVVATTSSPLQVQPNQCQYAPGNLPTTYTNLAAITATGTANLVILTGVATQPQLGNYDVSNVLPTMTLQTAGTINSQDQINFNGAGVNCYLSVTASSGSPSYSIAIQGKDTASGSYYTVVQSSPNATSGSITLTTFPGQPISSAANISRESFPLPRVWRLQVIIGGTGGPALTGTTGCSVLL